ncbi:MAG: GSCFA domain-containing protein [Bacteroides sp.]|nr:GSCFA domain-containing protein [Bacteroides sp.]
MDFRTIIQPVTGRRGLINHHAPILLIGSCFADNIGLCLENELFPAEVNPFGPLYNPKSILKAFEILEKIQRIEADNLITHSGLWHSFYFHSRYSSTDRHKAIETMNRKIEDGSSCLRNAAAVIITLGTTRAFSLREDNGDKTVVANCHKLPSTMFDTRYLSLNDVTETLDNTIKLIHNVNREAKIIFTVSPLRYNENGAHANQLSKSTLLLGIEEAMKHDATGLSEYFPAYEIMMDDLRDYRFYAEDMKHPSRQAIDYIYQLFKETYCDIDTQTLATECGKLTRRLSHRPLDSSPESIEQHKKNLTCVTDDFIARFPKLEPICRRYLNIILNNGI